MPQGPSLWIAALLGALAAGLGRVIAILPNIIGALVVLFVGWGIGKLVQRIVMQGLQSFHFNEVTERAGINDALRRADIKIVPSAILGIIAYWFIFLVSIDVALSVLGFTVLTGLLTGILLYLLRIFAALLVVIVGAWAANILARIVRAWATGSAIGYASTLAVVVQYLVLFFAFAMALDVLGLAFPFLTTAFAIVVGAGALAGAIAFGLGGREYAEDFIAGRELRAVYKPGDQLIMDNMTGVVQEIRSTLTVMRTAQGNVTLQNSELIRQHITRPSHVTGEGGGFSQAA